MTRPQPPILHSGGSLVQCSPGNRLISQLSCFLEILVQLRSRETGCRRMMPLSIRGVMDLQWFKSMRVHNRLSQHLGARPSKRGNIRVGSSLGEPPAWLWSVPHLPSPRRGSLTLPSGLFCLVSVLFSPGRGCSGVTALPPMESTNTSNVFTGGFMTPSTDQISKQPCSMPVHR